MKLYVTQDFYEQWVKSFGSAPEWFVIMPKMK